MHIVIHACGIPFNGESIEKQSLGGSETAAYYVAKELAAKGHEVLVFTDTTEPGEWDGVQYLSAGEHTQEHPLGADWHFYCENTPHDVNIVQRHPLAYLRPNAAKINLFWAHDIALKRNDGAMMNTLVNCDAVMPVSSWFKEQICNTWTVNPDIVHPIHNGVDYSMFEEFELKDNSKYDGPLTMMYSSRPERGLEHLVRPGGIMDRLNQEGSEAKLLVCGYDHDVPKLQGYYGGLHQQVEALPNCEHLGNLTKRELYRYMCEEVDMWIYPTEFEEVSCISAMEYMAAGCYIATTKTAALPETIGSYDNLVMFPEPDEDRFFKFLRDFKPRFRRRSKKEYPWSRAAEEIEAVALESFEVRADVDAKARHFLRFSDIAALKTLDSSFYTDEVSNQLEYYKFTESKEAYQKQYEDGTKEMYEEKSWKYEENFEYHARFQAVAAPIANVQADGLRIVDYGCAHGHFTNNLARMFPNHEFIGIDVSESAIRIAQDKASDWNLDNVSFYQGDWLFDELEKLPCEVLILGEILEHVPDPQAFMERVYKVVGPKTFVIVTTPFGPWESASYVSGHPYRFHLHHFERSDIQEMFAHHSEFQLQCMPAGNSPFGEIQGWYVYSFILEKGADVCRPINYERKLLETVPKQTVSLCVIAKDAEHDLPRLVKSAEPIIDELVVGVDSATSDRTKESIFRVVEDINSKGRAPELLVKILDIPPAVETGFSEARNATIREASCQWIMWADCDEELISGERIWRKLRNNQWNGYGIPQHHFSTEPLGVLSTDFPVRLFRNFSGIQFEGIVHEHPVKPENPNEGVGFALQIQDSHFSHYGYKTEAVRRGRFERNIHLMARDRKENPDRLLGKFLWIRDLALMNRFELQENGGRITPEMQQRASIGLELWEDTLDNYGDAPQTIRMVRDHLEFYDVLVNCMDQGFGISMKFASSPGASAPDLNHVPEMRARFLNRRHLDKFLSVVIEGEVKQHEAKYL